MRKARVSYQSITDWLAKTKRTPLDGARDLGISVSYIYYLMRGTKSPSRALLSRISHLGVDPRSFL